MNYYSSNVERILVDEDSQFNQLFWTISLLYGKYIDLFSCSTLKGVKYRLKAIYINLMENDLMERIKFTFIFSGGYHSITLLFKTF